MHLDSPALFPPRAGPRARLAGRALPLALALGLTVLPGRAPALPDDREQELTMDATRSETYFDEERTVLFGHPRQPALITQGSLQISGLEVTIEEQDGELLRITATGNAGTPARFQQQPEADQPIVYANGRIIVYDSVAGLLTIDVAAELERAGSKLNSHHVEYDLNANTVKASAEAEGQLKLIIPPGALDSGDSDSPAEPAQ